MTTASIQWHFEQSTLMPIIRVRGTTTEKALQPVLLSKSVELLERASKFNGAPLLSHDIPDISTSLMVSFTIVFKSHKHAQEFLQTIK